MTGANVFQMVAEGFSREKIPCVLIGGYVVGIYNYPRLTTDVDLMINQEDFERVKNLLLVAGYKLDHQQDAFAQFSGDKDKLMDLDLMLVDQDTLQTIMREGKKATVSGKEFIIPSLFHLIALKLHAIKNNPEWRELKDLLDIAMLVKVNKVDVRSKEFKDLCLKYGTDVLYEKISAAFKNGK